MSSVKISELPSASEITGTEEVPIVQSGTTKKAQAGALGVKITYSTTDLTAGVSELTNGTFYFVYE